MPSTKRTITRRKTIFPIVLRVAVGVLLVGLVLVSSGFGFAASRESHDPFCASCHTQPETTYFERSTSAPVDLASAHKPENTRCIDCHSGEGLTGRLQAELLGAHNALAYLTHTAVQPAPLTRPIEDASCLKCHADVTGRQDFNNHFHNLLPRWQAVDPQAATCVSCHSGHTTDGSADLAYLNEARTRIVCEDCHRAAGSD
jgi:nitrate/TMAO reductase-like tetraheme cytochrome c subunit